MRVLSFLLLGGLSGVVATLVNQKYIGTEEPWGASHLPADHKDLHTLRFCNVYPSKESMDVFLVESQLARIPYAQCKDMYVSLIPGARINCQLANGMKAGVFEIGNLPEKDSRMLLVIKKHADVGNAASFMSHVYKPLPTQDRSDPPSQTAAQAVFLDGYTGDEPYLLTMRDAENGAFIHKHPDGLIPHMEEDRKQRLPKDGKVDLHRGVYVIDMHDKDGKVVSSKDFLVARENQYTVIRMGGKDVLGLEKPFVEDFLVFPETHISEVWGGDASKAGFDFGFVIQWWKFATVIILFGVVIYYAERK